MDWRWAGEKFQDSFRPGSEDAGRMLETFDRAMGARLRRAYDALLTGIPFGVFKVAAGSTLSEIAPVLGLTFVVWGSLDILLNLLAVAAPGSFSWCLLSNLGRRGGAAWEDRMLAVDTFLSFAIVSTMIGFHLLGGLPPVLSRAWDVAVIANVMGVGLDRLYRSWVR